MCCGYAVGRGFTHKESVVQPHLGRKLDSAKEEGVELITTTCPGCNVALDREQNNPGSKEVLVLTISRLSTWAN